MNQRLALLACALLSSTAGAQDFLQQWRDSAAKAMQEFRAAHSATIEAAGWKFAGGAVSAEGVPLADVFVKDVKAGQGSVKSADVLSVAYTPVPASSVPEHQSVKALVWFDCAAATYQDRALQRYASVDGSGQPSSSESAPAETAMRHAEPGSAEAAALSAVCKGG